MPCPPRRALSSPAAGSRLRCGVWGSAAARARAAVLLGSVCSPGLRGQRGAECGAGQAGPGRRGRLPGAWLLAPGARLASGRRAARGLALGGSGHRGADLCVVCSLGETRGGGDFFFFLNFACVLGMSVAPAASPSDFVPLESSGGTSAPACCPGILRLETNSWG